MTVKDRLKRTAILALIGLIIGAGLGLYQIKMHNAGSGAAQESSTMQVAGAAIGGPFTLVNEGGTTVTEQDFAGQYKLIYFGFTYCPAICPTELQKITLALNTLAEEDADMAGKIRPVFISVDPERDTPDVLKEYVTLFHPRMTGLTGSPQQVEAAKKSFRVYAAKVQTEEANDYTVDHSSFIYFMGPDNSLISIYRMEDTAAQIAADIKKHMAAASP